jgi:hypothetical protein
MFDFLDEATVFKPVSAIFPRVLQLLRETLAAGKCFVVSPSPFTKVQASADNGIHFELKG